MVIEFKGTVLFIPIPSGRPHRADPTSSSSSLLFNPSINHPRCRTHRHMHGAVAVEVNVFQFLVICCPILHTSVRELI